MAKQIFFSFLFVYYKTKEILLMSSCALRVASMLCFCYVLYNLKIINVVHFESLSLVKDRLTTHRWSSPGEHQSVET